MVALSWIRGASHRWKTFVSNRVEEIQILTEPSEWQHVKGTDNPADYVWRGTILKDEQLNIWLNGPHWLRSESVWSSVLIIWMFWKMPF